MRVSCFWEFIIANQDILVIALIKITHSSLCFVYRRDAFAIRRITEESATIHCVLL